MTYNKTTLIILLASSPLINAAELNSSKKLFLFSDLSSYQEKINTDIKDEKILELSDSTVLDSFNYQLMKNGERINLEYLKILPKSEKNIFLINKNENISVNVNNNIKTGKLISEGVDFIKIETTNGLTQYIPKIKIDDISFTKNINSENHIVQIKTYDDLENVDLNINYTLGEIKWKPKYVLNLMEDNNAKFDYIIEVDNNTSLDFNNIQLALSTDSINRINNYFDKGLNEYIFTVFNNSKNDTPIPINYAQDSRMELRMFKAESNINTARDINVMGKESIVFDNPITITSKAKTNLEYNINKSFNYKRKNNYTLFVNKYNPITIKSPKTEIELIRKNNNNSTKLVSGVMSVYSDKDIYQGQLITEVNIPDTDKNQNINFDFGDNNNIKIHSKYEKEKQYSIFIENDINKKLMENKITAYYSNFNITSNKIYKDETLEINANKIIITKENEKKELINILENFNNKTLTNKEYIIFINNLKEKFSSKIIYNENDLNNEIKENVIIVEF